MNFPHIKTPRCGETTPVRVELAPGREVVMRLPREAVGKWCLTRIMLDGEGRLRVHLPSISRTVKLTKDLPGRLGLDIDVMTLRTLVYAGFVASSRVSPLCTLVDLDSLMRHIEATRNRDFWTPERVARYREAYQAIHHEGMISRGAHARPASPSSGAGRGRSGNPSAPEPPEQFTLFPDDDAG